MDAIDRRLVALLQGDATLAYAQLADAVGLSPSAVHGRVRSLRASGAIRRTTIDVDAAAFGRPITAYVLVHGAAWLGGEPTRGALAALPRLEEAHVIAGDASLLLKARAASTEDLQDALRQVYELAGVASTESIVVLETFFERPIDVGAGA
jgi:Lrp/AsnC family transcriptional regulator, leucine-responsive regulatory protein